MKSYKGGAKVFMKIRKMKYGILEILRKAQIEGKTEKNINTFYKNNYKYQINTIENENIIIIYKEDTKSEDFEVEIFEII